LEDQTTVLADYAFLSGLPFIPVRLDTMKLQLGPWIEPKTGPCWFCWEKRALQHSSDAHALRLLRKYQETSPQAMRVGFLDPQARFAAALLLACVTSENSLRPGAYLEIDLLNGAREEGHLVGVHDCECCGLGRDFQNRSFEMMRDELSDVLPSNILSGKAIQHE
jgi:bacteriocin biosynthesis cyclodehydratase domain-containing protein